MQTNRLPTGFLDLVGAETGGKTPPRYADFLSPSLDMRELYLAQTIGSYNNTLLVNAEGVALEELIPNNEAWLLRSACAFYTATNAADAVRITLRIRRASRMGAGDFPSIWSSRLLNPGAIGLRATDSVSFACPLLCPPGTMISWIAEENAGANKNVRLQMVLNKLNMGS